MQIFGRNLIWYAAVFGAITAISRSAVTDELLVHDPEGEMSLVVQHTHYMPRRWRGKENTEKVRMEFETLFKVVMLISFLYFFLPHSPAVVSNNLLYEEGNMFKHYV